MAQQPKESHASKLSNDPLLSAPVVEAVAQALADAYYEQREEWHDERAPAILAAIRAALDESPIVACWAAEREYDDAREAEVHARLRLDKANIAFRTAWDSLTNEQKHTYIERYSKRT